MSKVTADKDRIACGPVGRRPRMGRSSPWTLALGSVGVVYRRYRHEPALRLPRSRGRRRGGRSGDARGGARRPLDDPVGVDHRRHDQIRAHPAACRQQGRRRYPVAHGARRARDRPAYDAGVHARRDRRRDVSRRRGHHAGDFGAFGGRGVEARIARLRALRRPAHHRHSVRSVRGAEPRHRESRGLLRAGHAGVVRFDRARGAAAHQRRPRRDDGHQPVARDALRL